MEDKREHTPLLQDKIVIVQDAQYSTCGKVATSKKMLVLFLTAAVGALVIGGAIGLGTRLTIDENTVKVNVVDSDLPPKSEMGLYRYAAVTVDNHDCSAVGLKILAEQHGSAVDAAIATSLCSGLQSMDSCGIGGGHFMTIYEKPNDGQGKIFATLDARETAPSGVDNIDSFTGGNAIAVPGEIAGLHAAWRKFGRLPWKDLFQPAISMAKQGIYIGRHLAGRIANLEKVLYEGKVTREVFFKNGQVVKEGDYVTNERLARTLAVIAEEGPEAFYNGSLTQDIIDDVRDHGGMLTAEDLASYQAVWRKPFISSLPSRQWKMVSTPAPSSGPVLQYMLRILDGYNLTHDDLKDDKSTTTYHRLIETMKFGYARRSQLGDPYFENITQVMQNLASQAYVDWSRSRITDDRTHDVSYYGGHDEISDGGTCHISIKTADGAAVSLTTTINTSFGTKYIGSRTGVIFNDEMTDFSTRGSVLTPGANIARPGKRPLSSTCPTIMVDSQDRVQIVIGGTGGTMILSSVFYVAAHNIWLGKSLNTAVDTPRLHTQLDPTVLYEAGFSQEILKGLENKGHVMKVETSGQPSVQVIKDMCGSCMSTRCRQDCVHAVCDGRKYGIPDGF